MSKQPKLRRCKWLGVGPKERLSRLGGYPCLAPVPDLPPMPASVTSSYGFRWPPVRSWVGVGEHCANCPLYEPKKDDV